MVLNKPNKKEIIIGYNNNDDAYNKEASKRLAGSSKNPHGEEKVWGTISGSLS